MNPPANVLYVSSSGAVKAAPGELLGVVLAGGTAASTVTIYDNPSAASGTVLLVLKCAANEGAVFSAPAPIRASAGLYAALDGSGATAAVVYY